MADFTALQNRGDVPLQDPLREVTRKERRALLGVSTAAIAVAKTGLLPTEIVALGVKFSPTDRVGLVFVAALIVLYFMVAFIVYAAVDLLAWRWAYHIAQLRLLSEVETETARRSEERSVVGIRRQPEPVTRPRFTYRRVAGPVAVIRAVFDFGLPIIVGGAAVIALLRMTV